MKRSHSLLCAALFAAMAVPSASAALDSIPSIKVDKLTITPAGRILLDGAVYTPGGDGLNAGVAMPDIRFGGKMSYGNWAAKIDVGYGYGKLSMKDVYLQYKFNGSNLLRGGYFVHQFGLNAATSSSMKPAMEAPTSDDFFKATGRNLGIMYVYDHKAFFAGVSAILDGTSLTTPSNQQGKASYGGLTRLVYRPLHSTGLIVQAGVSGWIQSALHKATEEDGQYTVSQGYFDFGANFPTRVCKTSMLSADVTDASSVFKFTPELLVAKNRLALEGQYYYMNVARKGDLKSYKASGVYGLLRGILIGGDYGYSHADAGLATPAPKTLELVAGYNYTDANCSEAGIFGGRSNDASLTFNYYVNKYVIARLRYRYTNVKGSDVVPDRHVNMVQARIQVIF